MPRAIRVLAIATIAFGLAVEPLGRDLGWLPDLLTGWALAACGVVVARARPQSRVGLLLAASGVLWFAGNLASSDVTLLAEAGTGARFLYRAPLVLAVLTVPEGRPASRRHATVVAAAALMAVIPAVGQRLPGALSLALLVVVAGASRPVALPGAAALALVVTGGSVITHVLAPGQAVVAVSAAYGAGLVVAAGISVLATVRAEWSPAELADALVADADSTVHAFRDALAEAVGDRSLAVGFLDAAPSASPGQEVTQIDVDGVMVAALVHRPGALRDPVLHDAVRAATRLQAANVRLQRDLRAQADALTVSGRRLLAAGDEQRRRLERRVRAGPLARLEALDARLAGLGSDALTGARENLATSVEELRMLAIGLHPGVAAGLALGPALSALAVRAPVPTHVDAATLPVLPDAVRTALLFTCGEALANVAKHAAATHAEIRIVAADHGGVELTVADDGRGGADPAAGSGLNGLRDRLELLGGTLTVGAGERGGTRLLATLPVGHDP